MVHRLFPIIRLILRRNNLMFLSPFQYLPAPDQFSKLSEFKDEYEYLTEPEKFVLSLSDVKR